jgi:hypothetical protein
MILACRPTDKLTELITSAMEKNEEGKKGAIANTRLYEGNEKARINKSPRPVYFKWLIN